jgi:hypothetical protein
MSKIQLTKFEAAQLLVQSSATLTAGVLSNPTCPVHDRDIVRQAMQTSTEISQELFDLLGFEIEP